MEDGLESVNGLPKPHMQPPSLRRRRSPAVVAAVAVGLLLTFIVGVRVFGDFLLRQAIAHHSLPAVSVLLFAGAPVNHASRVGVTPLIMSADQGDRDLRITETLLRHGADANTQSSNGYTAVHRAAIGGQPATVKLLLAHGANPRTRSAIGWTPLLSALDSKSMECVSALLAAGADPNGQSPAGKTWASFAAQMDGTETASVLLAHGADVNVRNGDGLTPLLLAAYVGRADLTALLIKAGADVNLDDGKRGMTPLMMAASTGKTGVVRLLLANGADSHATMQTRGGPKTALDLAKRGGFVGVAEALAGAQPPLRP